MSIDIRIQPICESMASIQINCHCGCSLTKQPGGTREFKHLVLVGGTETNGFSLFCTSCSKEYVVRIQQDHFHVFEAKP